MDSRFDKNSVRCDELPLPQRYPSPSQERRASERNRIRISFIAAPFIGLGVAILLIVTSSPLVASNAASKKAVVKVTGSTPEARAGAAPLATGVPSPASTVASTPSPATARSIAPPPAEPAALPSTPVPAITATATTARAAATQTPISKPMTHVVEKGDTLYSIARRYGTSVDALVTTNGLGSKDNPLKIGLALVVSGP